MKAVIKQVVAGPLRFGVRYVLQRPALKKRLRDMVTRMPRLHSLAMRVMFEAPVRAQSRISGDEKNLSPQGRRVHRALKRVIEIQRRR